MDASSLMSTFTETLTAWVEDAVGMLPNIALALVVMVITWFVALAVAGAVRRGMRRVASNMQLADLTGRIARVGLILAGAFIALQILKLETWVTSILAGVGIAGVALGFAFQDIAANLMSGILMAVRQPFRIDDLVETASHRGVVEELNLRSTVLRTPTGETVRVPNKDIYGAPVVNYTDTDDRRVDLDCGVAYDSDLPAVRHTVLDAVSALDCKHPERDVSFHWTGFGGSSIDFTVKMWVASSDQSTWNTARSRMVECVKAALDDAGVVIPFPIRTLDGAVRLADARDDEEAADAQDGDEDVEAA